jgi:hypothetical protein
MGAHRRLLIASATGALAAAGCAGPSVLPGHGGHGQDSQPSAFQQSVTVIKGWSTALRTGHVRAAAEYFQIPSVFFNGPGDDFVLHSFAAAEFVNRLLPCGAKYLSATQHGPYVNALFKLTDRSGPGGGTPGCGTGTTARVNFIIHDGKITHWLRAPSQPGDNRATPPAKGNSSATTTSPQTGTSPGTNTVPPGTQTAPPGTQTAPGTETVPPGATTVPTTPEPGTGTAAGPKV